MDQLWTKSTSQRERNLLSAGVTGTFAQLTPEVLKIIEKEVSCPSENETSLHIKEEPSRAM